MSTEYKFFFSGIKNRLKLISFLRQICFKYGCPQTLKDLSKLIPPGTDKIVIDPTMLCEQKDYSLANISDYISKNLSIDIAEYQFLVEENYSSSDLDKDLTKARDWLKNLSLEDALMVQILIDHAYRSAVPKAY